MLYDLFVGRWQFRLDTTNGFVLRYKSNEVGWYFKVGYFLVGRS